MRLDWLAALCVCSAEALRFLHWRTGTQPERHTITLGTIFVTRGSVLPHAGGGLEIPQAYPKGAPSGSPARTHKSCNSTSGCDGARDAGPRSCRASPSQAQQVKDAGQVVVLDIVIIIVNPLHCRGLNCREGSSSLSTLMHRGLFTPVAVKQAGSIFRLWDIQKRAKGPCLCTSDFLYQYCNCPLTLNVRR